MNQKVLTLAVAAALVTPMAAHADVKLSGTVQAEAVSWEVAGGDETVSRVNSSGTSSDDMDRQMLTNDAGGVILNEGPNAIQIDFDQELPGGGASAFGRYAASFNTSNNQGLDGKAEAWVGLKGSYVYFKYGTLTGAYKSSRGYVDPWSYTSLQTSGTGGGMSGETHNRVVLKDNKYTVNTAVTSNRGGMGLTNEGFVDGALELGVKLGGFYARVQGVLDDRSDMDGAGLLELRYVAPNFAMWVSGAYTDLDLKNRVTDPLEDIQDTITGDETVEEVDEGFGNWKIGGSFKLGQLIKFGLQYEDSEIGAFDENADGGQYILGSLEIGSDTGLAFAGWVAQYRSDIEENNRMLDKEGNPMDEDALNWAAGIKYRFSKRTMIYLGYRQTDSDNDYRDENVATMGIRHSF